MSVQKYRKKPVVVEALLWDGTNKQEVFDFAAGAVATTDGDKIKIITLEGGIYSSPGDYIIKGVKGEFYPCQPDIFEFTYEQV